MTSQTPAYMTNNCYSVALEGFRRKAAQYASGFFQGWDEINRMAFRSAILPIEAFDELDRESARKAAIEIIRASVPDYLDGNR